MRSLTKTWLAIGLGIGLLIAPGTLFAQDETPPETTPAVDNESETDTDTTSEEIGEAAEKTSETVGNVVDDTSDKIKEISKEVDESEEAKQVSAGILQPIYQLAEVLAFPAFHWVAFAIMATGVVSYALQLVLGKLVVLTKMGFSISEILSDALGLAISTFGLVLTTQAAVENSTFTNSPAAVLSASAVGVVAGFVFYLWGQAQEVAAAKGRRVENIAKED